MYLKTLLSIIITLFLSTMLATAEDYLIIHTVDGETSVNLAEIDSITFTTVEEEDPEPFEVDENTAALWHFDENEGDIAFDATENDYDLNLEDGATWSDPGRIGQSKSDLTDGDAKLNSDHVFGTGWEAITLEAYIYPTQLSDEEHHGHIITRYTYYNTNPAWDIAISSTGQIIGGIYLSDNQNTSAGSEAGVIETDQWYHVAFTWSSGNPSRIFVNGELVGTGPERDGSIRESNHPLTVGWYHDTGYGDFYFDGFIDEARISDIDRYPVDE
ncbi:MAG: LamG domain-containing protein [Calditrichaeota bacterium]|nr:LamG domain-containing protein [Calditrichota bacterium]